MTNHAEPITLHQLKRCIPTRTHDSHKGMFGHVLVVGGDYGMPGSVRLAAESAARIGAGLVTVATRPEHITTTIIGRPELLCYGLHDASTELQTLIEKASMIVLGPGLGQSSWSKQLFHSTMASTKPLLIDADGLNWLARDLHHPTKSPLILTPHPGEAARLLSTNSSEIQANRIEAIQYLHKKFGGIVILKGANTLLMTNDKPLKICTAGNPAMATAGMGDLLSGIIAGLIAQACPPWEAAQLGVLLHAMAADLIVKKQGSRGLLAGDLLSVLPTLLRKLS